MSMTDNISDMLTRIRNAQKSKIINISLPHSKIKCNILEVLKSEGYIKNYKVVGQDNIRQITIDLKYSVDGKAAICEIKRVSKPGKRVYTSLDKLKGCYNNMGIYVLSTPQGVVSDREAYGLEVGGEIICKVF